LVGHPYDLGLQPVTSVFFGWLCYGGQFGGWCHHFDL
jgi:hypothetical protein